MKLIFYFARRNFWRISSSFFHSLETSLCQKKNTWGELSSLQTNRAKIDLCVPRSYAFEVQSMKCMNFSLSNNTAFSYQVPCLSLLILQPEIKTFHNMFLLFDIALFSNRKMQNILKLYNNFSFVHIRLNTYKLITR